MYRATLIVLMVLSLLSATAMAQDSGEPTEGQYELNAEGIQAFKAGELDKAESLFRASLNLGPLNITWLNLGRVLQRQGQCQEARQAFESALSAPPVPSPTQEQVLRKVSEYLLELQDCSEPDAAVAVTPADTDPAEEPPAVSPTPAQTSGSQVLGWSLLGTGSAAVVVSVVYDLVLGADIENFLRKNDDAGYSSEAEFRSAKKGLEDRQLLVNIGYGVSASLIAAGGLLLLLTDADEPGVRLDLAPTPGGAAVFLEARW